jgi:hypothetical protein
MVEDRETGQRHVEKVGLWAQMKSAIIAEWAIPCMGQMTDAHQDVSVVVHLDEQFALNHGYSLEYT